MGTSGNFIPNMKDKNTERNFTIIFNEIIVCRVISLTAFRIFCFLKRFGPRIYPSYNRISEGTGLSKSTISLAIKELCARNILTYRKGSSRTQLANEYKIKEREVHIDEEKVKEWEKSF